MPGRRSTSSPPSTGWPHRSRDSLGISPRRRPSPPIPCSSTWPTWPRRGPNPWRKSIPEARPIAIEAGKNLSFSPSTLTATAGEAVRLTFVNPDVVPHNFVLVRPGALSRVGEQCNRLVADPEAFARQYIPETEDVLVYTDLVEPNDRATISFRVPEEPGRYPFLCSFPGHWMVMNGQLIVTPANAASD